MRAGVATVVVPSFNRAAYIGEALDSVHAQSYRPLELIVVDDGSTDATAETVERWRQTIAADDPFTFKFVRRGVNRGANAARNLGLCMARGEFVQFLDSDDKLGPEKIACHIAHFAGSPHLDLSIGQTRAWDDPERSLHAHRAYPLDEVQRLSIVWSPFGTLGPMIRASAVRENSLWWDESLPSCQDWEYFTRLVQHGLEFDYCLEARAFFRPADGRRRTGHHSEAPTVGWLDSRLRQLSSLWRHATESVRNSFRFRLLFSLEVARVAAALHAAEHDPEEALSTARQLLFEAAKIENSTLARAVWHALPPIARTAQRACYKLGV